MVILSYVRYGDWLSLRFGRHFRIESILLLNLVCSRGAGALRYSHLLLRRVKLRVQNTLILLLQVVKPIKEDVGRVSFI